jgi:TrkA domain protein
MATRESELPGVGKKWTIELSSGEEFVLVEHRLGHWELARIDAQGETIPLGQLQAREAAEIGRILSRGAVAVEDPRKRMLFEQFTIEWAKLEESSPLVGQTLRGAEIRPRTGVSVIAVLRPEGSLPSPPPDTELLAGDTLVVIGLSDQVERFLSTYALLPPGA